MTRLEEIKSRLSISKQMQLLKDTPEPELNDYYVLDVSYLLELVEHYRSALKAIDDFKDDGIHPPIWICIARESLAKEIGE